MQGLPILLPLPNVITSIDIVVITAAPINVPPYNMTPVTSIWPVQVNSNCTNMTTGITYYATVFGNQELQLALNSDGTGLIDTSDLASRTQPILSLITGYSPITQTATLSDTLTITTGANTSILSATDLTFNGLSIQPIPNTFDFTINSIPFSFSCVTSGKQYTMVPQSSFSITLTDTQLLLDTLIDFSTNFLSAVIYRDNVFYPLQVDLVTGHLIVLTGNFSGTQTVYFSGIIFSS